MRGWRGLSRRLVAVGVAVTAMAAGTVATIAPVRPAGAAPTRPGPASAPEAAAAGPSVYVPVIPCRVVDTRNADDGPLAPSGQRSFQVTDTPGGFAPQGGNAAGCGIPTGATAVEASVSAVSPTTVGFLRVWPDGGPVPNATFLNWSGNGWSITNTGSVPLSATGRVATRNYSGRTTHVVIDVNGYYLPASAPSPPAGASLYVPITPCRIVDTRRADPDHLGLEPSLASSYTVTGGDWFEAQGGRTGGCRVPEGATAAEVSVSVAAPTAPGFLRIWPRGQRAPNATFLNWSGGGRSITNTGSVPLSGSGTVDTRNYSGRATDIVIDVNGYHVVAEAPRAGGAGSISGAQMHTCTVAGRGSVRCWGRSNGGSLGDGSTIRSATPVTVAAPPDAIAVTTGYAHTCILGYSGTVDCWGANGSGRLGDGTTTSRWTPVQVTPHTDFTEVSAGGGHTCAVRADGTVWCWGSNGAGQLGDASGSDSPTPVQVITPYDAAFVSVFAGLEHSCAVTRDGSASCWGDNHFGQLGGGLDLDQVPVAFPVVGLTDAVAVTGGEAHSCALIGDGTVECWGQNLQGQLGDGTNVDSATPVQVAGVTDAVAISGGAHHTCAVLGDGSVVCWGLGEDGRLGDGGTTSAASPVTVARLGGVTAVGAGWWHSCAVVDDGSRHCWGSNIFGQLGSDVGFSSPTPVPVTGF